MDSYQKYELKTGADNKRKIAALLTASALVGACTACSGTGSDATKDADTNTPHEGGYNILFITTDQERYFETPPSGTNWRARELLRSSGASFEKHYICSNMSTSSRSVIYTGQHITGTKMEDNTDMPWQSSLSEDIPTIGDLMRDAGYYTAFKGKFHMFAGGVSEGSDGAESLQRQDDLEVYGFSDWNPEGDIAGGVLDGYNYDDFIKGSAVSWLRKTGAELNESGAPFFLAVNFVNPHDIMYYNPDGKQTVMPTNDAPDNTVYAKRYNYLPPAWEYAPSEKSGIPAHKEYQDMWRVQTGGLPGESGDKDAVGRYNDYYLNCIQDQDNSMAGLLEEIERLNMTDNTIIIFTSDHGEMSGSHGLTGKGNFVYENNIRVPFIVVHPEYKGNRRINAVTSHLDIAPTVLDMTNIPDAEKERISKGLAGHSLTPLLDGGAESVRSGALYAQSQIVTLDAAYNPFAEGSSPDLTKRGILRGIVTERYKFARYFSPLEFNTPDTLDGLYRYNDVELYDLENDPDEIDNLAADREKNAELIEEMNRRLNELIALEIGEDNGGEMEAVMKFLDTER